MCIFKRHAIIRLRLHWISIALSIRLPYDALKVLFPLDKMFLCILSAFISVKWQMPFTFFHYQRIHTVKMKIKLAINLYYLKSDILHNKWLLTDLLFLIWNKYNVESPFNTFWEQNIIVFLRYKTNPGFATCHFQMLLMVMPYFRFKYVIPII